MKDTKIEWCDHSWSPWRGCTKVSPGCANCYAETLSKRNPAVLGQWGKGKPRVLAKSWGEPVKWNRVAGNGACKCCGSTRDTDCTGNCKACGEVKRLYCKPTVFPSLCDWMDDEVPVEWLAKFLKLIHDTPNLTWLLLTKRPENFVSQLRLAAGELGVAGEQGDKGASDAWGMVFDWIKGTPPPNVWVGTSVEDDVRMNQRGPLLSAIPARSRFLSMEPLLGPVDTGLTYYDGPQWQFGENAPDWVIIGGESGPGARPCNVEWIRSVVRQCKDAAVPCFVKQLGARARDLVHDEDGNPLGIKHLVLTHPKGGDPAEWPEDLRVREIPEGLR